MGSFKKQPITVNGKYYESKMEACRKHGIKYQKVQWRLKQGWTVDEAFGIVDRKKYDFELNGKYYPSLRSLYYDNEEYLQKINNGKIYYKKVTNRMSKGYTYKQALGVEPIDRPRKNSKPITVENIKYNTLAAAVRAYKLDYNLVCSRLSLGWSVEEAFNIVKKHERIDTSNIILEGKKYKFLAEACRVYNKKYSKVLWRIKHGGYTLEEAFELVDRKVKRNGKK